ncbi:MAG: NUDIX hydrolase [Syntrophales bacterium LBB04]|nr:NUDIX hydrolase [Syntrophales bacterium LBB04]
MRRNTKLQKWETLSSEVVYRAQHWFTIVKDVVKLPNDRIVEDYYRIEAPEYILIYAKSHDGKVLVERQYKHGIGSITTTFPAGFIDDDESPLDAAKRELIEETGFRASTWKTMGSYVIDGTRHYGTAHYFMAEDLERVSEPMLNDMEQIEIDFLPVDGLMELIAQGSISLLPGVAIIAMATNPYFSRLFTVVESRS